MKEKAWDFMNKLNIHNLLAVSKKIEEIVTKGNSVEEVYNAMDTLKEATEMDMAQQKMDWDEVVEVVRNYMEKYGPLECHDRYGTYEIEEFEIEFNDIPSVIHINQ